jgi:hypothetical protein
VDSAVKQGPLFPSKAEAFAATPSAVPVPVALSKRWVHEGHDAHLRSVVRIIESVVFL